MKKLNQYIQEKLHVSSYKKEENKSNIDIITNFLKFTIESEQENEIREYCKKYNIDKVIIVADKISIDNCDYKSKLTKDEIYEIEKNITYDDILFGYCLEACSSLVGPNSKKNNVIDLDLLGEGEEYLVGNKKNLMEYVYEQGDVTVFFLKVDENNNPVK